MVVASYYLLGLPLAYCLAWPLHLETLGLSLGALAGTAANLLSFAWLLGRTDWQQVAITARQRLAK